ncbi:MAG: hypothetical protein Sapg2KO_30650 [Saprospiraceae bacterium]
MKLKVGIFFGGPSRERGRSFVKAKQVFQKLDQSLFEPLVFFIDIKLQLYQCEPSILYHKNIKALFGASMDEFTLYQESLENRSEIQQKEIYWKIGRLVQLDVLPQLINIAFVETWADQQTDAWLLAYLIDYRIPYIGVDAEVRQMRTQKSVFLTKMEEYDIKHFNFHTIDKKAWLAGRAVALEETQQEITFPVRLSPDQQHDFFADSSLEKGTSTEDLQEAIDRAFFQETIPVSSWQSRGHFDRKDHIRYLTHVRKGLGFPVEVHSPQGTFLMHHPKDLLSLLDEQTAQIEAESAYFKLSSQLPADRVLIEEIPTGTPFEVLVLEDKQGAALALYPQVPKPKSPYKLGLTQLQLDQIRIKATQFYTKMKLGPLVLLKGIYTAEDEVLFDLPAISCSLDDDGALLKNWTAYHLDSHQLLLYYVAASLRRRMRIHPEQKTNEALVAHLQALRSAQIASTEAPTIAVILGGNGAQENQAQSAARYFWEVVDGLRTFPVQLYKYDADNKQIYEIEPSELRSDWESVQGTANWKKSPLFFEVNEALQTLLGGFKIDLKLESASVALSDLKAGFVYPVLTGALRNGTIQRILKQQNIPYNGSDHQTLGIVNDNPKMMQALARNACLVPTQVEVKRSDFNSNLLGLIQNLETQFVYPMLVHSGDQDQSILRHQINKRSEFIAYAQLLFRPKGSLASEARQVLRIKNSEDIPTKTAFWVEAMPDQSWTRLLSSLFCHHSEDGEVLYEVLGHSVYEEETLITPASKVLPAIQHLEVQKNVNLELERIARLLNLQSFVTIESYLRIFADNSIQLMLSQVDALPFLNADHPLLAHALLAGRNPAQVFQAMFADHLKQALPLQKTTFEPTMVNNEDENKEVEQPISNDPALTPVPTDPDKEASFFKRTLLAIKSFLGSPIFWKNVGGIIVASLLLFGLTLFLLGRYTHHGSSYVVEDYIDMNFDDAKRKARGKTLRAVVIDSIFLIGEAPNIVKDQDPKPGSKVKKRRTIYMWVTGGQAPEILLPNLAGKDDFETYRRELERRNVRLIIKERKFDRKLQENTLLGFYYRGDKISTEMVNDGFKVVEGSTLEAIVSQRTSDQLPIPNLVCATFEAAKFNIESSRLILGEVYGTRANNAYVWKQEPAFEEGAQIKTGTVIKLHLTSDRPADCQ